MTGAFDRAPHAPGVEEELRPRGSALPRAGTARQTLVPEPGDRLKIRALPVPGRDEHAGVRRRVRGARRDAAAARGGRGAPDAEGVSLLSAGMHPTGRGDEQEVIDLPRYRKMAGEPRRRAQRQFVAAPRSRRAARCGRVPRSVRGGRRAAARAALFVSEPRRSRGRGTGHRRSTRATRPAESPGSSVPPELPTWKAWEDVTSERDYTRLWWMRARTRASARSRCECPTPSRTVRRAAGLAALVQALRRCGGGWKSGDDRCSTARRTSGGVRRPRHAGTRGGAMDASERAARALGNVALVEELFCPAEAERLLALGRREGVDAVVADLVDRSRS